VETHRPLLHFIGEFDFGKEAQFFEFGAVFRKGVPGLHRIGIFIGQKSAD